MILGNCAENKNYDRCCTADISILKRFCPICPDDFVWLFTTLMILSELS